MAATKWYDDAKDVRDFGIALINAEVLTDTDDFADYLKKPSRYTAAFTSWDEYDRPDETDAEWQDFVDSVTAE